MFDKYLPKIVPFDVENYVGSGRATDDSIIGACALGAG